MDEKSGKKVKKYQPLQAAQSPDNLTLDFDRSEFEDLLPQLAGELINHEQSKRSINSFFEEVPEKAENESYVSEPQLETPLELQNPDAVAFIRRCQTEAEALEIIDFLEKRSELSHTTAEQYRERLATQGIRSFGSLKTAGYYERKYRRDLTNIQSLLRDN